MTARNVILSRPTAEDRAMKADWQVQLQSLVAGHTTRGPNAASLSLSLSLSLTHFHSTDWNIRQHRQEREAGGSTMNFWPLPVPPAVLHVAMHNILSAV